MSLLTTQTQSNIEKWADYIRQITGETDGPPVSPELICSHLGIHLRSEYRLGAPGEAAGRITFHGWLTAEAPNVEIVVNAFDAPNRRRFTIAHEIGHYVLHMAPSRFVSNIEFQDNDRTMYRSWELFGDPNMIRMEREANYFAGCLLMPTDWVRSARRSFWHQIPQMAQHFEVSEQALRIRLQEVGKL